jgi:hypothetical protein
VFFHNKLIWLTRAEATRFSRLHAVPLAQRISVNDYNHAIQVSVDWLMRENTIDSLRSAYGLFITQVIVSNSGEFAFDSNALFLNSVRRGAM